MTFVANAIIRSAHLTTEDYGVLTLMLQLDYGEMTQGFGGYNLCGSIGNPQKPYRGDFNWCGIFIRRVLDIAEVSSFEKLQGRPVRVRRESEFGNCPIQAIGHYVKDKWFDPEADIRKLEAGEGV